jgi:diguanylate cyclase (GGDEF)-like protein
MGSRGNYAGSKLSLMRWKTMKDLEFIIARLKVNEEIAQKFFMVETKILSILNFRDLFEVLLSEIRKNFNVPFVWISIIKKSRLSKLIKSAGSSNTLKEHLNNIARNRFTELVGPEMKPILINTNLEPYFELFPRGEKYDINSIAVSPISYEGEVVGSLNMADISELRFQPGLDTDFLEQISVKVSLCLSNVVAHEKLKFFAYHDPLTGLLNRRVMEDVLKREFTRANRYKKSLSAIFIDLDDFKRVNDTYGHKRGDDFLKHVAKHLMKMCRETDVVARYAGDEFVLTLPETSPENAEDLMSRIIKNFDNNPFKRRRVTIPVDLSYGVASTESETIKSHLQLIRKADQEMYKAKKKKYKRVRDRH